MIPLTNHSQTEQGWFYVNFDGHLASFTSMKIRKKSNSFVLYQAAQFHLQIVNNYAYVRKESAPGTSRYLVSLLWSYTKLSQYVQ